jgi:hypothetical protein
MSNDTVIISLKEKIDNLNQQAWEVRVTDLPKAFELSENQLNWRVALIIKRFSGRAPVIRIFICPVF